MKILIYSVTSKTVESNHPLNHPAQIAGVSAYGRRAGWIPKLASVTADFALGATVFFVACIFCGALPLADLWHPLGLLVATNLACFIPRKIFGTSPGMLIWGMRVKEHSLRISGFEANRLISAIFLTLLATASAGFSFHRWTRSSPLWLRADSETGQPFLPDAAALQTEWAITPFFYSLGAWPRQFNRKPVFYVLPYEKGPPAKFIGHLQARWVPGDIDLTLEGPLTPKPYQLKAVSRETLKDCLTAGVKNLASLADCSSAREATLGKAISEMTKHESGGPEKWELSWIEIRNPAIPAEEQAQGVRIRATGRLLGEERVILISPHGTHQSFGLRYKLNAEGALAREKFEQSIRSLRLSDNLAPGQGWINRQLEAFELEDVLKFRDPDAALLKIADAETLLVSKASVDPATFETFFHLAGTAVLLVQIGASRNDPELSAIAKSVIQNSYRYARDISPGDPRTAKLETLWNHSDQLFYSSFR